MQHGVGRSGLEAPQSPHKPRRSIAALDQEQEPKSSRDDRVMEAIEKKAGVRLLDNQRLVSQFSSDIIDRQRQGGPWSGRQR
jgi:hypothetical protein